MKIEAIDLALLRVPLRRPFRTALRTVEAVQDVVVRIRTDTGHVGHGSAAPTAAITGDTQVSIVEAIRHHIAPRLLGQAIADADGLVQRVQSAMARNTSAKAAVEIALHDLFGQQRGLPLYRLLGGDGDPVLRSDITISVDSADAMVAEAMDAIARGFDALKIKLGKGADDDIARVLAIHAAVAGRATLRLDANQGWSATQAVHVVQRLEAAGVPLELVEQPVPGHDIDGLRHVAQHVRTPVMADEAAFDARQAAEILQRGAAGIVNIKLMKAGGVSEALRVADLAARHGVPCMMGCMLESSIGVLAAAHVAVARAATIRYVDLDPPSLCASDPVDGSATFDGPRIMLGDAPGLGIRTVHGLVPIDA